MFDYHLHSSYSKDGFVDPVQVVNKADELGLKEICFTDHLDFDENYQEDFQLDVSSYVSAVRKIQSINHGIRIKLGFEVGLKDEIASDKAWNAIKKFDPDFIIGSVHRTNKGDPYKKEYFENNLSKTEIYRHYYDQLALRCRSSSFYNVLGHYDYVAKFSPYSEKSVSYDLYDEALDSTFNYLIDHNMGMEINTSVFRNESQVMWGFDVYKRFSEMGGEYVTIGSDAHKLRYIGWRIDEALQLAQRAGIKYVATFTKLKPELHKIK